MLLGNLKKAGREEDQLKKTLVMNRFFSVVFLLFSLVSSAQNIEVYSKKTTNGFVLMADNPAYTPVSANIIYTLENLKLNGSDVVVVKPQKRKQVIGKLHIIDRSKPSKFSYKYTTNFGDTFLEDFDEDYEYRLPFAKDSTYTVIQGYDGNFSHQGEEALDFKMPVGSPVMAAREGLVVKVVENFDKGCPEKECAEFGNVVRIMHSDGTFAEYVHLKLDGAVVEEGQKVEKGQLIGYSGNTGFSTAPHLHFVVYLQKIFARTTVPTLFKIDKDSAPFIPEQGKDYRNDMPLLQI